MKQSLASNEDFAGSPVDVLELESDHFPGAKTKTGKQKKDGVVAAAGRHATVAGLEHTFDFLRSQELGHCGQSPIRYRGYRGGQVSLQFSLLKQEPQEGRESSGYQLRSSDTHAVAVPQNKI